MFANYILKIKTKKDMEKKSSYDRLVEIKNTYPELTFDNHGYEYLSQEVKELHKAQIEEISTILKDTVVGFVRFDNFKPRKNGLFAVRMQAKWSENFTGVRYNEIEDFKNEES
jgi:hypothetical protein